MAILPFPESSLPALRARIRAAALRPEAECVAELLQRNPLSATQIAAARGPAQALIRALRTQRSHAHGVDAMMREFSLSSQEGVALLCLAESLLRIPDAATADALIRDKLARGDWRAHIGPSRSVFLNAAAWGLLLTGKLSATHSETGLTAAVTRAIARGGEPLVRAAIDTAMRMLGEQFVLGKTIDQALARARSARGRGYRHSYDMLGEAALTAAEAKRYFDAYAGAIAAIAAAEPVADAAAAPMPPEDRLRRRASVSVKLSALHPRFESLQEDRVRRELLPRIRELCRLARKHGLALDLDAEEGERLEPLLDIVEALAFDPALADWNGLGIAVQAYQKRALPVIDWLAALARESGRRIGVRLVKGAYWDREIKRTQVEGLADYPVYTRKAHTDAAYLVCARRLLDHGDHLFPQFATHNALTLCLILQMTAAAGIAPGSGRFEFQCLHGMGEALYDRVLAAKAAGPVPSGLVCRIYAPVGRHETLLPYLVRRLLENGANSSFVRRIVDASVEIDHLLEDPFATARQSEGAPHPAIPLPAHITAPRRNASGIDLHDPGAAAAQRAAIDRAVEHTGIYEVEAILARVPATAGAEAHGEATAAAPDVPGRRTIRNPARHGEIVGTVRDADATEIDAAFAAAVDSIWLKTEPGERAAILEAAADALESCRDEFLALAIREAGKTLGAAIAEVREAVDACRYYAQQLHSTDAGSTGSPVGTVVAISPWNFPLAIFVGQVAAALAAGNPVLAKPAEQTPLIAARAVQCLHAAGVPRSALQLLPGDGAVGAMLVRDVRVHGVLFTGSTDTAQDVDRAVATLPTHRDRILIAETGGLNAMIVDASAQPEQVVLDALRSAFDSAGQRCSALRILCLQEEIAEPMLEMLLGAAAELRVGDPAALATDIGPVIDGSARAALDAHLASFPANRVLARIPLSPECAEGSFFSPAIVAIESVDELAREAFGPILHVLRYRRADLETLVDALNATGYALTCGIQSRVDETVAAIAAGIEAGNVYANRNMIGAAIGMQPFGGHGLSGTGPKMGGPWIVRRLRREAAAPVDTANPQSCIARWGAHRESGAPAALHDFQRWLSTDGRHELAQICAEYAACTPIGCRVDLPAPTGESNVLRYRPLGRILCLGSGHRLAGRGVLAQLAAVLATDNRALLLADARSRAVLSGIPASVWMNIDWVEDWGREPFEAALFEGDDGRAHNLRWLLARRPGRRIALLRPSAEERYALDRLVTEQTITVNTAAAGGNAALMSLSGDGT